MNIKSRIIAIILSVALSPVFIFIFIFSFVFQGLPIFYSQKRVGFKKKQFRIYKFRTMINNNSMNKLAKLNDSRVTKWGKFLRYYKLDELPQLINIINGDMVFIGPRPELNFYVSQYDQYFKYLNKIKPGITDLSSILFRDEDRIITQYFGQVGYFKILKIKSDLTNHYQNKRRLINDFKIILFTIIIIFFPKYGIKKLVLPTFLKKFPEKVKLFNEIY